jgi:hypothetical protein
VSNYERVTLEELLAEYDERAPTQPKRTLIPWWARATLSALVFGAAGYVVLRVVGIAIPYPLIAGTIAAVILLRRALAAVAPPPLPAALVSPAWGVLDETGPGSADDVDGLRRAVNRWEMRLGWTDRDPVRFATAVRPKLVELVAERLRQRHGVVLSADPVRARRLIGEPLWRFLHEPVARNPTPEEVAAMVAELERL